eukprot:5169892-Karenia_brevis.AAC.1
MIIIIIIIICTIIIIFIIIIIDMDLEVVGRTAMYALADSLLVTRCHQGEWKANSRCYRQRVAATINRLH